MTSEDYNKNHGEGGRFTSSGEGSSGNGSKSEKSEQTPESSSKSLQTVAKLCTIKAADGIQVKGYSSHVLERMESRGIDEASMENAIAFPLHITPDKIDESGQPSRQYIGSKVTAVVNPETGVITTCWPTSRQRRKKYGGE